MQSNNTMIEYKIKSNWKLNLNKKMSIKIRK